MGQRILAAAGLFVLLGGISLIVLSQGGVMAIAGVMLIVSGACTLIGQSLRLRERGAPRKSWTESIRTTPLGQLLLTGLICALPVALAFYLIKNDSLGLIIAATLAYLFSLVITKGLLGLIDVEEVGESGPQDS